MLEVAPGVYVSPDLSSGVRERVWGVLEDWFTALGNGAVVMLWRDGTGAGGLALRHLGDPPKEIATDAPAARSGKVYPRGGGGAVEVRRAFVEVLGSIPACAGKPEAPRRL